MKLNRFYHVPTFSLLYQTWWAVSSPLRSLSHRITHVTWIWHFLTTLTALLEKTFTKCSSHTLLTRCKPNFSRNSCTWTMPSKRLPAISPFPNHWYSLLPLAQVIRRFHWMVRTYRQQMWNSRTPSIVAQSQEWQPTWIQFKMSFNQK